MHDTFFTITDVDTKYTNSRSKRFPTAEEATAAAQLRLTMDPDNVGVHIMMCVGTVTPSPNPHRYLFTFMFYPKSGCSSCYRCEETITARSQEEARKKFDTMWYRNIGVVSVKELE